MDLTTQLRNAAGNNRVQAENGLDSAGYRLDHAQIVGKRTVAQMHDAAADEIERLRIAAKTEREACARIAETGADFALPRMAELQRSIAKAIRSRVDE